MPRFLAKLSKRLTSLLPPELESRELWYLLSSRNHSLLLNRRRATMIVNRVRLFAFLFAVLTPLWSVIDFIVFDSPLWIYLAIIRVLASVAFFGLFFAYQAPGRLLDAYRSMALLFAVPTAFYIASHLLISDQSLDNISASLATGYAFLPFVLMAGLALFPLTLKENVLVSAVIICAQGLVGVMHWSTLNWPSFMGGFWLLILISAVVALASLSQLAFMIALVRQVMRDPLTGAITRGSGEELLGFFWQRASRRNLSLSMAFFDLDHFKLINDRYGHEAGDKVLRDFAKLVSDNKRASDILLRWGGEEFLLLMPDTSLTDANNMLKRLQEKGFGVRPDGNELTASIGLAERLLDTLPTEQALLELADQRMYQAKEQGRNRIVAVS